MRVLHVVTRMNVGGVATLVLQLTQALSAQGIEVTLATGEVQEGEVEAAGLPADLVRVPGLGRAPRLGDDVRALRALRRLARELRPDIVHTHTAKAGALGRIAVEGLGVTRVHTFHGHLLHGYFSPRVTRAVTLAESLLARRTDLLISSGQQVAAELRTAGVGAGARWVVIPPGVLPPVPVGPKEPRTVAFVGRLVPVKRVDRLVETARLLPDVTFLVAGDGPLRAELSAVAPPNVQFLGWTRNVGEVYGRASVVLLCSDNEAMPLALIEGALCGLPGVTTAAGSADEVVEDGVTGRVASADPQALAGALREILDDPDRLAELGSAALRAAREHYTVEAMARSHVDAYSSLLGAGH